MSSLHLIRLQAAKQEYDWGRPGSSSLAARLAHNSIGHGFCIEQNKSYAEIWMGTHPNGPARLFDTPSTALLELISTNPALYLGERLLRKWPSTTYLPYLFKVLSIQKALPLQAHPDKALAEQLHREDPATFVDANHKPEIAIAIGEPLCVTNAKAGPGNGIPDVGDPDTAFTGFVGFRPLEDIKTFIQSVPELAEAVGDAALTHKFVQSPSRDLLKRVYARLLKRGVDAREEVAVAINQLQERIKNEGGNLAFRDSEELARLVLKVNAQYPGDAGVLATVFFMNFAKLRKGEALYIGADEVHAYLEGDIIECMAVSDNVVNAGFDSPSSLASQVNTFVDMLTYTARPASHWSLPAQTYQRAQLGRTVKYDPPMEEFVVGGTFLDAAKARKEHLGAVDGPTVGIVTRGKVRITANKGEENDQLDLDEGGVVFVLPGHDIQAQLLEGSGHAITGEVWWSFFDA